MNNLINFFNAISDETRLRMLVLLYNKELCVCEICEILEVSQTKISRHLAKLRDIGLVKDERQNQRVFYSLNIQDEQIINIIMGINDNFKNYTLIKRDLDRLEIKNSDFK